ncbi:MAG: hypothetical protein EOO88_41540, partial [Pedobacter sp.]
MIRSFNGVLIVLLLFLTSCKKTSDNNEGASQSSLVAVNIPGVYFTDLAKVGAGQASPVIMDKLREMINATPVGAHIYLSIFGFDHTGLIAALNAAALR